MGFDIEGKTKFPAPRATSMEEPVYGGDGGVGYDIEYALEDNGLHITAFGTQANPKAQDKYTVTRGFEKMAFPKAVRLVQSGDLKLRQKALLTVSELLSTGEACIQLLSAGIVAALTACLTDKDQMVRERAATGLEIIVGVGGEAGCQQMLRDGAVDALLKLLVDPVDEVRNAVYNALVEGCLRSAAVQAHLVATEGTLKALLNKAAGKEEPMRASCALEILRVCLAGRNSEAPQQLIEAGALNSLTKLIGHEDTAVKEGAALVLSLLCVQWEAKSMAVNCGAVPALVKLMELQELSSKTVATAALMNICVDIAGKEAAVQAGMIPLLVHGLDVDDEKLILNSLQCVASVAENYKARAELQTLIPRLSEMMHHHVTVIQRHAMLAKRAVEFTEVG